MSTYAFSAGVMGLGHHGAAPGSPQQDGPLARLLDAGMNANEAHSWLREIHHDKRLSIEAAIAWHQVGMTCEDSLEWLVYGEWDPTEAAMWAGGGLNPRQAAFTAAVLRWRKNHDGDSRPVQDIATAWTNANLPAHLICHAVAAGLDVPHARMAHLTNVSGNSDYLAELRDRGAQIGADPGRLTFHEEKPMPPSKFDTN